MGNVHSKSLVPDREISITDSNEEVEEQCYNVMAVIEEPNRALINYCAMTFRRNHLLQQCAANKVNILSLKRTMPLARSFKLSMI
jgi:hypothetical protein